MKSKIVLWGTNAQDEKILIAAALRADDNKVDIWTFPESVANEEFYQKMMSEWRDGAGLEFPEDHTHQERELNVSEALLPDDIKVERTDLVQRAQTEWHFVVLSEKLHDAYENEVQELKERVDNLSQYDQGVWDRLKEFWDKVQEQVKERNLFRRHGDQLRDEVDELFTKLKNLRSKMDEEFERVSKEIFDRLESNIESIEKKIKEGSGRFPVLFDELKNLQRQIRKESLTRAHRGVIWSKIDAAFKEVKMNRFGDRQPSSNSPYDRIKHRYDGLLAAIQRMEQSIRKDNKDLEFQQRKIATTDGQLEAQIRQAKLLMIEERVNSKKEKLTEMLATKAELEKRMEVEKARENRRAAQDAVKEKIADEIKSAAEAREDETEVLEKAAEEIRVAHQKAAKPPRATTPKKTEAKAEDKKDDSLLDAVSATLGESLEDIADTVKAIAAVVGEQIEDAIEDLKETLNGEPDEPADDSMTQADAEVETKEDTAEENEVVVASEEKEGSMPEIASEVDEVLMEEGVVSEISSDEPKKS
jgi:hypothetical protein